MQLSHLIAFNIALLAAIVSPGPALLVAIKTTLTTGRKAGISVGLGLALIASLWTLAALLGLDALFNLFPWVYAAAKALGAAYLLYIAIGMWRGADKPITADTAPGRHAFRQGVMINLLNPKAMLFAAAVLVVVFPADLTVANTIVVVCNHFGLEALAYTILAVAMGKPQVREAYLRAKARIDRLSAVILSFMGLRLLLSR